jgi:hypothetical protein
MTQKVKRCDSYTTHIFPGLLRSDGDNVIVCEQVSPAQSTQACNPSAIHAMSWIVAGRMRKQMEQSNRYIQNAI